MLTREMVERMFPGCEYCDDPCSPRLDWEYGIDHILPDYGFCPMCGKPITDEAVDMMVKRMEEIYK